LIHKDDARAARRQDRRRADELQGRNPRQSLTAGHHPFTVIAPAMFIKTLLALTMALAAALPARAQDPLPIWPEPADQLVREAIDSAYAEALLKAFAASVRRNGDPSCLQAKMLDEAASVARGRALLQRHGLRMMKIQEENFDRVAYQSALSASAGPGAVAEIERLKRDPEVKALVALYRPAQLAKVVDAIVEQFDRYLLIGRIKLDPVSSVASGEIEPLKDDPKQAAEAAVQRFLDKHASRRLDRYLDLQNAVEAAMPKGFRTPAASKPGPMAYFAGAEQDLAELCIDRR
jgi:hypothetical protein